MDIINVKIIRKEKKDIKPSNTKEIINVKSLVGMKAGYYDKYNEEEKINE